MILNVMENLMKKLKTKSAIGRLLMVAVLSLAVVGGSAVAKGTTDGYDFEYSISGDRQVAPSQVFDSNAETFFQFPPDRTVPAIFAVTPCKQRVLLPPTMRGPYVVVKGVYKQYALQLGVMSGGVTYAGKKEIALEENIANEPSCGGQMAGDTAAKYGAVTARAAYGVTAPIMGDGPSRVVSTQERRQTPPQAATRSQPSTEELRAIATRAMADRKSEPLPVAPVAKDPPAPSVSQAATILPAPSSEKAITVSEADRAVAPIATADAPVQEVPKPQWKLEKGVMLGPQLKSWGAKAGWNVIWNNSKDWTVPADTSYVGEFDEAAKEVVSTLAENGALISAKFFNGNKTLVISGPGSSGK